MIRRLSPDLISDSEEERLRKCQSVSLEIIEISSDDDDNSLTTDGTRQGQNTPVNTGSFRGPSEIIELTDSDTPSHDTSSDFPDKLTDLVKSPTKIPRKPVAQRPKDFLSLYVDESDADDGSILVLNEPRSARKPIRRAQISTVNSHSSGEDKRLSGTSQAILGSITPRINKPPPRIPTRRKAEEQARREKYAAQLFEELNSTIFNNGLPRETKLNWNKRLLTTAGRAKWHRSRDGVQTTEIELATKILDCDERIRNTLSHEMCHLASWIINSSPKEGHGQIFKAWANKVMVKHPEIEITVGNYERKTRHNYEISYPFEWKCEKCSKVYDKFSKSIRPDECVCGVCKIGKLIPLFMQRAPRTPKASRMATALPRDSPRPVQETRQTPTDSTVYSISSEDEVDILIGAIDHVTLNDGETPLRAT
ncbi:SprT-like family-domain-containing protein [Suillus bovinus]|uniref:SprT-like family-domain-containing protein n=1 Tax=Suillus bovinus TaxID=48563 RepID=UPI001B8702AE|nr:SprT-like family-domain-containing protein [Suillus bovinus]KAG2146512.1 SprT-like family-domain-containing protein [Suillus bovinus]